MYIYDFYLKNGERTIFYAREPFIPNEVKEFAKKNKGNIEAKFCDHFPQTIESFFGDSELKSNEIICE